MSIARPIVGVVNGVGRKICEGRVKRGKQMARYCHVIVDKSQVFMGSNGEYRTVRKGNDKIGYRFCTNQKQDRTG